MANDLTLNNEALALQSPERAGFHAYLHARKIDDPSERADYLQSLWRNETVTVLNSPENSDNYEVRARHTAFALARIEAAGLLTDLELRGIIPGDNLGEDTDDNQRLLRERYDAVVNEFAEANMRSAMIYWQLGLVNKWGKKVDPDDYNRDEQDSTPESRRESHRAALNIANNYAPRVNAEALPGILRVLGISNPERVVSRMFRTRQGLGNTFDGFYQMVCQMIGQKPNMRIEQWQLGEKLGRLLPDDPNDAGYLYTDHGFGRILNAIKNSWWNSFRPAGSVEVSSSERTAMETMGFLAHSTWASAVLAGRVIIDGNDNRLTKANFVEFQRMLFDYYNKTKGFGGQMSAYSEAVKDLVIFINGWLGNRG